MAVDVVAALVVEEGRFMICQRPANKARGLLWEFVGGKVERGEDLTEALKRELREEMALTATILSPYMTVRHTYPDFVVTLHVFLCAMASDYRLLEHEGAEWLAPYDLHPDEWAPADAPIVGQLKYDLTRGNL